jgi:uncharacterized membrane-anchored protein
MFEYLVMTFFTGAMVLVIVGGIAMWIISYVIDELKAVRGTSFWEWVVAIAVCLAIGSAVS